MFKLPLLQDIYSSKMAELNDFITETTKRIDNVTNDLNILKMFAATKLNQNLSRRYLKALDPQSSADLNSLLNQTTSELAKLTENLTAAKWLKQLFERIIKLKSTDLFSSIVCITPPLVTETVDPIDPLKPIIDYNLVYPLLLIPTDKIPLSLIRTNNGKNLDEKYRQNSDVSTGKAVNDKTLTTLPFNQTDYCQILLFGKNYNQTYGGKTEALLKKDDILLTEKAVYLDDLTKYFQPKTETATSSERSTAETERCNANANNGQ